MILQAQITHTPNLNSIIVTYTKHPTPSDKHDPFWVSKDNNNNHYHGMAMDLDDDSMVNG